MSAGFNKAEDMAPVAAAMELTAQRLAYLYCICKPMGLDELNYPAVWPPSTPSE